MACGACLGVIPDVIVAPRTRTGVGCQISCWIAASTVALSDRASEAGIITGRTDDSRVVKVASIAIALTSRVVQRAVREGGARETGGSIYLARSTGGVTQDAIVYRGVCSVSSRTNIIAQLFLQHELAYRGRADALSESPMEHVVFKEDVLSTGDEGVGGSHCKVWIERRVDLHCGETSDMIKVVEGGRGKCANGGRRVLVNLVTT